MLLQCFFGLNSWAVFNILALVDTSGQTTSHPNYKMWYEGLGLIPLFVGV